MAAAGVDGGEPRDGVVAVEVAAAPPQGMLADAPPEVVVTFSGISCWVPKSVGGQKSLLSLDGLKNLVSLKSAKAEQAKSEMRQVWLPACPTGSACTAA